MPPQEFTSATPGIVRSIGLTVYSWTFFSSMSDRLSDSTRYWNTSPIGVAGGPSCVSTPAGRFPAASCIRCVTCARERHVSVVTVGDDDKGEHSACDLARAARGRYYRRVA